MYCSECGSNNESEAVFCESCGFKLESNQPEPTPEILAKFTGQKVSAFLGNQEVHSFVGKHKKLLMAVPILIILLVIIGAVGSALTDPERIALECFKAVAECDSNALYSRLALQSSDFINKKSFEAYMEENASKPLPLVNYEIKENKNSNEPGLSQTYSIRYTLIGETNERTMPITLVKQKEKQWFLFDSYKAVIDGIVVTGVTVTVPAESQLFIDGVGLKNPSPSKNQPQYAVYDLPPLFVGTHEIEAVHPSCKTYSNTVSITGSGRNLQISDMRLSAETVDELVGDAKDKLMSITEAARDAKDYGELDFTIKEEARRLEYAESRYSDLVSFFGRDGDAKVTSVEFVAIESRDSQDTLNDGAQYVCRLRYEYALHETYINRDGALEEKESIRNGSAEFLYLFENGAWNLSGINQLSF